MILCILSVYHPSKISTLQWTMQLWRPHSLSYYLPNQPNYLVLIILFSVPGDSHALPGDLVHHYEPSSPKHPCPLKESFHTLLPTHYDLKLWFLQIQLLKQTFYLLHDARPSEELHSRLILLIIFHNEDTSVICKEDNFIRQTLTFYCLLYSLS